jgi:hypothetical protein
MFQEGLDIAHENVLRVLELMWMKFLDDASHYTHITCTYTPTTTSAVFAFAFVQCLFLCTMFCKIEAKRQL